MRDRYNILSLKAVAAIAEKLADDLEKGRLWPGQAADAVAEIRRHLEGIRNV